MHGIFKEFLYFLRFGLDNIPFLIALSVVVNLDA